MDRPSDRRPAKVAAVLALAVVLSSPAALAGDAAKGKTVFTAQCGMCHTATKGGPTILGPNLYGVVGRKAASVAGYNYSPGMKAAGWVWTDDKLDAYLPAPRAFVKGTKMTYGGLHDPEKRADLIAYLDSQK